jgi:hypothetical protein
VYTDQEKAGDYAAATSEARLMVVRWMEATQGQNLARRIIALAITAVWLLMYLIKTAGAVVSVWVEKPKLWLDTAVDTGVLFCRPAHGGYRESGYQEVQQRLVLKH